MICIGKRDETRKRKFHDGKAEKIVVKWNLNCSFYRRIWWIHYEWHLEAFERPIFSAGQIPLGDFFLCSLWFVWAHEHSPNWHWHFFYKKLIFIFSRLLRFLGFKDRSRFRMLGHMPWSMGKSFGRSSGLVLRRFYWPSYCCSKSSLHSFPPSKASSRLVWTESSVLGMFDRCIRESGECQNNKFSHLKWLKSFSFQNFHFCFRWNFSKANFSPNFSDDISASLSR